ncbi:conserved hypothetical protein [Hyella patelloides LEGE 07179]|uniref:Phosphodiester glycosidase domain-containing protein n=1 Tax=Hyella patelloides LEGE 07179 TaxID=945734 RepID=A0A563W1N4_9CYAN|nr:phosphodiester glycosidase family protein [Hyella patelloides]VEP17580.1 conserved hypothetical protein [Hyella patelloides LEGE 07179]
MIHKINSKIISKFVAGVILLLPLIFYSWRASLRPPITNSEKVLFQGIIYQRKIYSTSRPFIVHTVEIDLTTPGIKPFITPPKSISTISNNPALTTSEFIKKFNLQLAVNGSFFYRFHERTPWNYYPKSGEPTNVLGQSISNNLKYGKPESRWDILCFTKPNIAQISNQKKCPGGTVWGIAGGDTLVIDGKSKINYDTPSYARTAVATNKKGDKLWLIVVDGKQPFYSEGATLKELAEIAINLGADRALNLDGGGSTTLAIANGNSTKVLNAPIHNKIPMNERPLANHLGFYGMPKTQFTDRE